MNALTILKNAKALIVDPENWCVGNVLNDDDQSCAMGAINIAATGQAFGIAPPGTPRALAWEVLGNACTRNFGGQYGACTVNNTKGHTVIIQMFDEAIASLEPVVSEPVEVLEEELVLA